MAPEQETHGSEMGSLGRTGSPHRACDGGERRPGASGEGTGEEGPEGFCLDSRASVDVRGFRASLAGGFEPHFRLKHLWRRCLGTGKESSPPTPRHVFCGFKEE